MPRTKRLSFGEPDPAPPWLSHNDWSEIQMASKLVIKKPALTQVILATRAFSKFASLEKTAASKTAIEKIRKFGVMVRSLRLDFPSTETDQFFYDLDRHVEFITRTERQFVEYGPAFFLEALSHMLAEVDAICVARAVPDGGHA
jgi:hypothetical protein